MGVIQKSERYVAYHVHNVLRFAVGGVTQHHVGENPTHRSVGIFHVNSAVVPAVLLGLVYGVGAIRGAVDRFGRGKCFPFHGCNGKRAVCLGDLVAGGSFVIGTVLLGHPLQKHTSVVGVDQFEWILVYIQLFLMDNLALGQIHDKQVVCVHKVSAGIVPQYFRRDVDPVPVIKLEVPYPGICVLYRDFYRVHGQIARILHNFHKLCQRYIGNILTGRYHKKSHGVGKTQIVQRHGLPVFFRHHRHHDRAAAGSGTYGYDTAVRVSIQQIQRASVTVSTFRIGGLVNHVIGQSDIQHVQSYVSADG